MDEFAAPRRGFALRERKIGASFRRAAVCCNSLIQRDFLRRFRRSATSGKWMAHAICNGLHKPLRRNTYSRCILQPECSLKCEARAAPYRRTQDLRLAATISLDPGPNSKV